MGSLFRTAGTWLAPRRGPRQRPRYGDQNPASYSWAYGRLRDERRGEGCPSYCCALATVNPSDPLGVGATAQGGYLLSGVEDNNLDSPKKVQVMWTGVKYSPNRQTDITFSYYREIQNDYRLPPVCGPITGWRSSCAGTLNEYSLYADYHFTKRFDVYAGIAYSEVTGGLEIAIPHGPGVPYYYNNNIAPTVGVRYTF